MTRLFTLAGLLLLTTSCHYFGDKDDRVFGKSFTLTFTEPGYSLDWHKESHVASQVIITNLMEGLVAYEADEDQEHERDVPALAASWEAGQGNTQWTFKLKNDVSWSDGEPLRAEHFLISFRRLLSPETKSPLAEILFEIKNAKDFNSNKINSFEEVGVKAPDDQTLIFSLNQANPRFSQTLSHLSTYPMRQEHLNLYKGQGGKVESIPWIGPYKTTYISKKRILLIENKKYRSRISGIKKVEVLLDTKKNKALKMLKTKKADLAFDTLETYLGTNLIQTTLPGFETIQLTFNCLVKPFNNAVMRRVIGHALNREELSHIMPRTRALVGLIPPGVKGFESNRGLNFDPDMALLVLKNAGMTQELKKYRYHLYVPDIDVLPVAENIKEQLHKLLAVDITIVQSPFDLASKNPSMTLERVKGRSLDPIFYLSKYDRKSEKNISGWKNPTYDEFLRKQSLAQAQHLLLEKEIPVVPLLAYNHYLLSLPQVRGIKQSFLKFIDFKEITMER